MDLVSGNKATLITPAPPLLPSPSGGNPALVGYNNPGLAGAAGAAGAGAAGVVTGQPSVGTDHTEARAWPPPLHPRYKQQTVWNSTGFNRPRSDGSIIQRKSGAGAEAPVTGAMASPQTVLLFQMQR